MIAMPATGWVGIVNKPTENYRKDCAYSRNCRQTIFDAGEHLRGVIARGRRVDRLAFRNAGVYQWNLDRLMTMRAIHARTTKAGTSFHRFRTMHATKFDRFHRVHEVVPP